jgi:hypothetical protein
MQKPIRGLSDVVGQLMWRRNVFVAATILCFMVSFLGAPNIASGQEPRAGKEPRASCSFEENKGFERRMSPTREITAKFIVKPEANADVKQMRMHYVFSRILGRYASRQLYSSSLRRCSFSSEIAGTFDLYFELHSIGTNVHDECSLARCAQWLSELIEKMDIDQGEFRNAIDAIAKSQSRFESGYVRNPRLGVDRAVQEAYRHIYRPGTQERTLADLSAEDFADTKYDEFVAWFRSQQRVLRSAKDGNALPGQSSPGASTYVSQDHDSGCRANSNVNVEDLNIDAHGWGQRSMIFVNHGFKTNGIAGITNATLRALCPPYEKAPGVLDSQPWQEMASRISCSRDQMNRDRWLILFFKEAPPATSAQMRRYAHAIAQTLAVDHCVHPELRVIVVNFSQAR